MEGYIKETSQGIPELLPGYISKTLEAWHYVGPPTTLAGPFQIPFGLLDYSFIQGSHIIPPPIYTTLPTELTPLIHLCGMFPQI